nr:uncharacterized protein LOC117861543 [Setaria viridis]
MATFMMKSRRSSQGLLLLLSLLLLTFSVIPAPIRGERITEGGRKSKIVKAAVIHDDIFNGCWHHDASASNVCCTKDIGVRHQLPLQGAMQRLGVRHLLQRCNFVPATEN